MTTMRFWGGRTELFPNAEELAKKNGYPCPYTYLAATGQVDQWCEPVDPKEIEQIKTAEEIRRKMKA